MALAKLRHDTEAGPTIDASSPSASRAGNQGEPPNGDCTTSSTTSSSPIRSASAFKSRRARQDTWGGLLTPARPATTPTPALRSSHNPGPPAVALTRRTCEASTDRDQASWRRSRPWGRNGRLFPARVLVGYCCRCKARWSSRRWAAARRRRRAGRRRPAVAAARPELDHPVGPRRARGPGLHSAPAPRRRRLCIPVRPVRQRQPGAGPLRAGRLLPVHGSRAQAAARGAR